MPLEHRETTGKFRPPPELDANWDNPSYGGSRTLKVKQREGK